MAGITSKQRRARRVVITGMGDVSPVGLNVAESWRSVIASRSGVAPITRFDPAGYETAFAGEAVGFDPESVLDRKEARRMDRHVQMGIAALVEARAQACLTQADVDPTRVGLLMGSGMGSLESLEAGVETLLTSGPKRIGPFLAPMILPNMASGMAAIAAAAKGPVYGTVSACASSAHAIGEAMRTIQRGDADVMYAGGAEAPISRIGVAAFNAMGALSRRNDAPEKASRPFDADRDGFVLAEGAAVLVLEELEQALARGAEPLAELVGYGATDDANHMVQPAPDGEGIARAMDLAMASARLQASDIGYLNAHATSTKIGEKHETKAIKTTFGEAAASLPISSTKSMTGHLLGAAGSLEMIFSVLALRDGVLPPTINYETVDPDCDLDYVPNQARERRIDVAMSNSLGFGGHNVSLIVARYSR